jgi:long-subunit acyl-CoA synthetase (AMP-forming)
VLNYSSESDLSAIDKLQSTISPESCFNIQFTSGTTGRSKAARVSHFSLVNCGYEIGMNVNQNFIFQFYTPFTDPVHFISNFTSFFIHGENYLQESVMISTTTMLEFA